MASYLICFCLIRLALPACLTISFLFRQNLLSLIYLLLLLYMPMVKVPTSKTMAGGTGVFLKIVMVISLLTSIAQLSFQIVLLSMPPYGDFLPYCELLEKLLRHVGLIRLDGLSALNCTVALMPEVIMLAGSTATFVLASKFSRQTLSREPSAASAGTAQSEASAQGARRKRYRFVVAMGKYVCLALLCIAGAMRPSILSAVYFVTFLGGMTWWASYHTLGRAFAIVLRVVCLVAAVHILLLFAIQTQWVQELVGSDCNYCRYLGLTPLMNTTCIPDPRDFNFKEAEWASYLNPVVLVVLYYVLALESRLLMSPLVKRTAADNEFAKSDSPGLPLSRQLSVRLSQRRLVRNPTNRWRAATRKVKVQIRLRRFDLTETLSEHTPLMRSVSPSGVFRRSPTRSDSTRIPSVQLYQDPLGSVTITADHPLDDLIELSAVDDKENQEKDKSDSGARTTMLDHLLSAAISIIQLINKSSYIATNIIMMAWSITYHSWITFVLLLWASMLWMMPNQRRAMLRCSPFLVCYAMMLLIAQYIYSMDLTEQELPQEVQGFNLRQIGLEKPLELPVKPLLAKCLYTVMFWLTLRQYMQEKVEARRSSALEDMVAPLAITVGTATRGFSEQMESMPSPFMSRIGKFVKEFLTKFWIMVVAIMLFVIGISGDRMTVLRVVYMALFLVFILTFQLSYQAWRRMLFGFWITVIIYSMTILVTVYTYQFDHFQEYWEKYLGIPLALQLDIGLEKFQTGDLFVRLLTPTFFLIITVIQLHYFHKDFLDLSDITSRRTSTRTRESSVLRSEGSSAAATREMEEMEKEVTMNDVETHERPHLPSFRQLKHISINELKTLFHYAYWKVMEIVDFCWLFLELHILKIMLLSIMLMCIYDVCALHFIFILLAVVALMFSSRAHVIICHICSVLISIILLAKMVYQIDYIRHDRYAANCTDLMYIADPSKTVQNEHAVLDFDSLFDTATRQNLTVNNVDWFGFHKASATKNLPSLLKGYIGILLVATIMALVDVRQRYKRHLLGRFSGRPHSMFPHVKREDADRDLTTCIKYLLNYGFYKFGVEICLMATVALIGTRMDVYSVFYAIWLCVLFAMKREKLAEVWIFFQTFIVVMTPLQYAMAVGLPPGLCIEYPWYKSEILRRVQDWMYLPDLQHPPAAYKLACDFIVLLLACRQSLVFRIEKRHQDMEYPGGTNKDITHEADEPGFVNPVPDHISYIRSWLDIFKRGVLSSFMWVTLAIVFLAGTNRVNLFSIGYLVGSFIFLWQGEDIYLRPIKMILYWWNMLLGFNVFVICFKTLLQIPGCIFVTVMQLEACWVMQLLSIACIKKFPTTVASAGFGDPNECTVNRDDVGLVWDGICFGFLIMMRRLFMSYYFMHQVDETKAMTILASRGAELIEELREKQIVEQQEEEHTILEKIKLKMERIKATQQKIQGPAFKEPTSHYTENQAPLARSPSLNSQMQSGYHTPIEDDPPPLTPRTGSLLQAPTPSSAIMTHSLDGYLEPQRMSFGSPPTSELLPRVPSDESFPVFSPPPYGRAARAVGHRRQSSSIIGPPWMPRLQTPRQSVCLSSPRSHQASIRSGDYYMFDEFDDEELEDDKAEATADEEDEPQLGRRVTLGKLFATAMKKDIEQAADFALRSEQQGDQPDQQVGHEGLKRTASSPLPQRPSFHSALSEEQTELETPLPSPTASARSHGDDEPTESLAPPSGLGSRRHSKERTEYSASEVEDGDLEQLLADDEPPRRSSFWQRIWTYVKFSWAFVESAMVSLTKYLNRYSRDYRYVVKVLAMEKKMLKEKPGFGAGTRTGSSMVWQPLPESLLDRSRISYLTRWPESRAQGSKSMDSVGRIREEEFSRASTSECTTRQRDMLGVPEIRVLAPSLERGLDSDGSLYNPSLDELDQIQELSANDQIPIVRLLLALWYAIISHSDIVCYFVVFLNQIMSATMLSLPLPLMVFLWGTLTVPRPTKTFWVTIIAYTEAIVIIKCMFQFELLPWNQQAILENMPFYPPRIIGIEKKHNYAVYDLILLLIVFFHRFMLKSLGLWKSTDEPVMFTPNADEAFELESDGEGLLKVKPSPKIPLKKTFKERFLSKTRPEKSKRPTIDVTKEVSLNDIVLSDQTAGEDEQKMLEVGGLRRRSSDIRHLESHLRRHLPDSKIALRASPDARRVSKKLKFDEGSISERFDGEAGSSRQSISSNRSRSFIIVHTEKDDVSDHLPSAVKKVVARYFDSLKNFFVDLLSPYARVTADVYAYMFICDFFNFMVVIFGFAAFGTQQGDGGVSAYLEENKVPIPFLVMLILQFALIIVDRALFLRKFILGKIVFQFILVVGVHIWMFFILPAVTERQFNAALPPQMWYMVKCFYLLLSAYQIRCGYPTRILGNFLCKRYNMINMCLFKCFMAVPFLFELRALMDWIWTDTSMTLMDWLKMEDIFAHIFQLKCARRMESEYPAPRGEKKAPYMKYLVGGGALFLIIAIIWFPLVLFALGNTVGQPNLPYDVTVTLRIGPYEPIYKMSAQQSNIKGFNTYQWATMGSNYKTDRVAQTFLSNYDYSDAAAICLSGNSTNTWGISPPDRARLIKDVKSNAPIVIKFTWEVSRNSNNPAVPGHATESQDHYLDIASNGSLHPNRQLLLDMLNGSYDAAPILLQDMFPKFIKVTNRGKATVVTQLMKGPRKIDSSFRNLTLKLSHMETCNNCSVQWWELTEPNTDNVFGKFLKKLPFVDCQSLVLYVFNDKAFPEGLNFISGGGIIGLYTTMVLIASNIIRGFFTGISFTIMFDDMPNVDRIMQLCLDIYLVRESGELDLEEDLFAKLVFLYRSPETLIKWTRPREDDEADGDEPGPPMVAAN